jgi:hypothetical protein
MAYLKNNKENQGQNLVNIELKLLGEIKLLGLRIFETEAKHSKHKRPKKLDICSIPSFND